MTDDERVATAFTALAHPRRVRLFRLLCEQPELGRSLLSLKTATGFKDAPLLHHLRIMERAGLIARHRTGAIVLQSLTPGRLTEAMGRVDRLRASALPAQKTAGRRHSRVVDAAHVNH